MARKSSVEIDGEKYQVVDNMGFNHDAGGYVKFVQDGARRRAIFRMRGAKHWRFWNARDRTAPLRDVIRRPGSACPKGI